jgi:uncharacterized protein
MRRVHTNAIQHVQEQIRCLFASIGEGDVHGYSHAMAVYGHARKALKLMPNRPHIDKQMAVLYAALLHDVDDPKMFPKSDQQFLPNARLILESIQFNLIDLVLDMIKDVSFSKNGNKGALLDICNSHGAKSACTARPRWFYIPRDSDRLEALGTVGIARCIAYGYEIGRSLYNCDTPRVNRHTLYSTAAKFYFTNVNLQSTLDYFIAGLIPRSIMASNQPYFKQLAIQRSRSIEQVILLYGKLGMLTMEHVRGILADDAEALAMLPKD